MTIPGKARFLTVLQLCAIPVFIGSGLCALTSFGSVPRWKAEARIGQDLPDDWDRVFINHGTAYRWHGSTLLTAASFAGWAVSGTFLVVSGLTFQRKRSAGGLP